MKNLFFAVLFTCLVVTGCASKRLVVGDEMFKNIPANGQILYVLPKNPEKQNPPQVCPTVNGKLIVGIKCVPELDLFDVYNYMPLASQIAAFSVRQARLAAEHNSVVAIRERKLRKVKDTDTSLRGVANALISTTALAAALTIPGAAPAASGFLQGFSGGNDLSVSRTVTYEPLTEDLGVYYELSIPTEKGGVHQKYAFCNKTDKTPTCREKLFAALVKRQQSQVKPVPVIVDY